MLPLLAVLAVAGVLPFAAAIRDSFMRDVWGERSFVGLANYRFLLQDRAFGFSALLSLAWAVLQTLLVTGAGWGLALLLFESKALRGPVFLALLVPWAVPPIIAVPLWRMIIHGAAGESLLSFLSGLHVNLLTDAPASFAASLLVSTWMRLPVAAFVLYAALRALPARVLDAARLDGAGRALIAARIYLPLVRGSIAAVAAFEFAAGFKEFSVPFLLTGGGPPLAGLITERTVLGATTTLEVYLYDIFQGVSDYGLAAAYAAVAGLAVALLAGIAFFAGRGRAGGEAPPRRRRRAVMAGAAAPRDSASRRRAVAARVGRPLSVPGPLADTRVLAGRLLLGGLLAVSSILIVYALARTAFSGLSSTYIESFLPLFPTAGNFGEVLVEDEAGRSFLNTLLVSLVTALLCPLFTVPAALRLRKASAETRTLAFMAIQALSAAGGMHSLVPLYGVFRSLGLLGGYVPVVFVYLYHALPFALFTTTAWLEGFPPSIEESATLDGASRARCFVSILLPLSLPAAATGAMSAFLGAWNGFLVPLLFLDDDAKYTIALRLYSYVGSAASSSPRWNLFAAASIMSLAIVGLVLWRLGGPLGKAAVADHEE